MQTRVAPHTEGTTHFRVEGDHQLFGSIRTRTSKNGAMALLFASLLNRGTTTLKDMPQVEEVHRIVEVLRSIGANVEWKEKDIVISPPEQFNLSRMNKQSVTKTRSAIMLLGALSRWLEEFNIPCPGGCKLGDRSIAAHLYALAQLGIQATATDEHIQATTNNRRPSEVLLYEASTTATENAILAAATMNGTTVIRFASADYPVQELCYFLVKIGIRIEGIAQQALLSTEKMTSKQMLFTFQARTPSKQCCS